MAQVQWRRVDDSTFDGWSGYGSSWNYGSYQGGKTTGYYGRSSDGYIGALIKFTIPTSIPSTATITTITLYMWGCPSISAGTTTRASLAKTLASPNTPTAWYNRSDYLAWSTTDTNGTKGTDATHTYTFSSLSSAGIKAGNVVYFFVHGTSASSLVDYDYTQWFPYLSITYTEPTYKITYNKNDGSGTTSTPSDQSALTSGSTYTLKTLSQLGWSRSGYTFNGWSTSSSATSGTSAGTTQTCSDNKTWYATWTSSVSSKTITFKDGSGYNSNGTKTAYSNTAYFRFPGASDLQWARTGYTLAGWDTSSSGSTVVYSADTSYTIAYASLQSTYYAVWKANVTTKTIEFYSMLYLTSGTSPGTATASSSSSYFTFPDESDFSPAWSITGYTLVGWATTRANGGFNGTVAYYAGSTYPISYSNLQDTYYAVWTTTQVTFTYKAGSYASNTSDYFEEDYNYSSSNISLSSNYFTGGEQSNTKTTRYLTCNCNNGIFSNGSVSYSNNDYDYYITKYSQTGWQYNNSVSSGTQFTTHKATANQTFYPYWGSTSSSWNWGYIRFYLPSEEPTRSGYTFNGWNSNQNGTGAFYSSGGQITQQASSGYSNVTLYAIWTANTYTINYLQGDATTRGAPTSQSATCNVSISLSTPTTLWKKNSTTANSTSYTTTYYLQGGKLDTWNGPNSYSSSGTNTTYGTYYTCSSTAYDTISYTHNGWATSSGGSKAYNFGGSYSQSTTTTKSFYPSWSTTTTHTYAQRKMPTVSRVGYVLKGWSTSPSGTITYAVGATDSTADNSQTLYAIWEPEWTVKISNGTVWSNYHVWIYTGATTNGGWQQAIPYVYNGSTWKLTSL